MAGFEPMGGRLEAALREVTDGGPKGVPLETLRELEAEGMLRGVSKDILGDVYATVTEMGQAYFAEKEAWEEEKAREERERKAGERRKLIIEVASLVVAILSLVATALTFLFA